MEQVNREDWLDRELREAAPYIDDEGFTARVLQQLPPPRRRHDLLRAAILERLVALPVLWVFVLALASGLVIAAVGAAAALSRERGLQTGLLQA